MKKAKTISLRLTEQENYWLKAIARQSGRTQSEVVRSLIKNGHVKERISKDILRMQVFNYLCKRAAKCPLLAPTIDFSITQFL